MNGGVAEFVTRKAGSEDAAAIAKSWQEAYVGQLPHAYLMSLDEQLSAREEMWRTTLTSPADRTVVYVAEGSPGIVGFCSGGPAAGLLTTAPESCTRSTS